MKRIAAIILTALLLFSMTACDFFSDDQKETDSEVFENGSESSENIESDKGTDDPDDLNSIESVNYSFISQEEKNTWRSDLISVHNMTFLLKNLVILFYHSSFFYVNENRSP